MASSLTESDLLRVLQSRGQDTRFPEMWSDIVLAMPFPRRIVKQDRDFSGYGNHGTRVNGPTWTTGSVKGRGFGCLDFGGIGSGHYVQLDAAISFAGVPWSWASWADIDILYSYPGFFGNIFTSGNYTRALLYNTGRMDLYNDANSAQTMDPYAVTGTHHYAITFDGSTVTYYRDGVALGTDGHSGTFTFYRLGNYGNSGGDSIDGRLWDIVIASRCLTHSEIRTLATRPLIAYEPRSVRSYFAAGAATPSTIQIPTLTINL